MLFLIAIVRGPDTLFGQSIEDFHPPRGSVMGIIGGPPCQDFSRARRRPPTGHGRLMIKQFARCIVSGQPRWWLMENVPGVPTLILPGYETQRLNVFAWEFGLAQRRNRSFQFGSKDGVKLVINRRTQSHFSRLHPAVMAHDERVNFADLCELQGLPRNFKLPGLSLTAKIRAVGNGVPVPVARGIAEAIRDRAVTQPGESLNQLRHCGCGRQLTGTPRRVTATPACRKRLERSRKGQTPGTITLPQNPDQP